MVKEPQIIFLGTGGSPETINSQTRSGAGIVIQYGKHQVLLEAGPGTIQKAAHYGVDLRKTDIILVSHNHIGHSNDLNLAISKITDGGLNKNATLISTKETISGSDKILLSSYKNMLKEVKEVKAGDSMQIDEIRIQTLSTYHSNENVGFRITTPDFILTYSSDTALKKDLLNQYKGTDILILNVVGAHKYKSRFNLNIDRAAEIIEAIKPKLTILTHFGEEMIKFDPLYKARMVAKQTLQQVIAAHDGMVINPNSYSAHLDQRTLGKFIVKKEDKK